MMQPSTQGKPQPPQPRIGTVIDITDITPTMRQIRIADPSLHEITWIPGQHVGILIGEEGTEPTLRVYSVRHHNAEQGTIDLWILLKDLGPGSQWANHIRVGDRVRFGGPRGSFVLTPEALEAPYYVFAGEATAAVPIQAMLAALPTEKPVLGYLMAEKPGEEVPYSGPHALPWVYRHETPASPSPVLIEAFQSLTLPEKPGMAYLGGEAMTCQILRRYLIEERGWPASAIKAKPFWAPGKTGLH
jgi:NADPH-dependent ferric siderophore reductase